MRIRPLGPDGVMSRIEQLQARIDRVMGEPPEGLSAPATGALAEGRSDLAGAAQSGQSPLQGSIGKAGSQTVSFVQPLNPFGKGADIAGVDRAPSHLQGIIANAAREANVDPLLLEALVGVESDFNPKLVSHAGAKGLAQLMPNTAAALGVTDLFDPEQNVKGGAKFLAQMLKQFDGDQRLALAAYNAGPGAVRRAGGVPLYNETQRYVAKVMARYNAMRQNLGN